LFVENSTALPPPPLPPGPVLGSPPPPRYILGNVYDYLARTGQEGPGYGLYSYVLFPFNSPRAAYFLEQLFTTTGYRRHSLIEAQHLNIFYLPTQADKLRAVIDRTLSDSGRSAHPSGQEFATKFYDYALAQKLLAQICLMPSEVIRDLCATALTDGPYLLTYGRPMSTLSPVPPPYLVLDLSRVHEQAFREFIIAYQEQVKRGDYTDRQRLDTLRLRVLSIILTAADWIAPTTSAIANIIHITP
jgi:hypothetical protein